MSAGIGMHLLAVGQQASFDLLGRRSRREQLMVGFQTIEKPLRRVGQPIELPGLVRGSNGEQHRPQSPVNERDFAGHQLSLKYIWMIGQFAEAAENYRGTRVRPPRSSERFASQNRHGVRKDLVLLKEQTVLIQKRQE